MPKSIHIEKRAIGRGHPAFIIAEAGVNHNGDPTMAKELVLAAKRSGADCVKFQTFKAERVVTENAPKAKYQLGTTDPKESQIDMLRKLELELDAYPEIIALCKKEGIIFLSTPYNEEDVDFLDSVGVPAFKIASIGIVEPSFLQYVASKKKPVIVSTGMATMDEVRRGVEAFRATGNDQLIVLQCTTNYPSRLEDTHLRAMNAMRDECGVIVGYSDHTQTDTACMAAVALGAHVIEKHFTLNKNLPGPDQSSSADPEEFARLVSRIRETETVLGSKEKIPCEAEVRNAPGMRRSIVARKDIAKGTIVTREMLTLKRPGTGLSPWEYDRLIGARAERDIAADEPLSLDLFAFPR